MLSKRHGFRPSSKRRVNWVSLSHSPPVSRWAPIAVCMSILISFLAAEATDLRARFDDDDFHESHADSVRSSSSVSLIGGPESEILGDTRSADAGEVVVASGLWPQCGCSEARDNEDVITSTFGARLRNGVKNYHRGMDIDFSGQPVHAIAAGVVIFSDPTNDGYLITVSSTMENEAGQTENVLVHYLHLTNWFKFEDDVISQGEIIADIDNASGSHLHLGIRPVNDNSVRYHPVRFLPRVEAGNAPKFQGDGVQGGDYSITSLSPRCEEYDLIRMIIEVYYVDELNPQLEGWKAGYIEFEEKDDMNHLLVFRFHNNAPYSFEVRLDPEALVLAADYHEINITVDADFDLPNDSYVRVCLEDFAGFLRAGVAAFSSTPASPKSGTCPADGYSIGCAGNVNGDTPGGVALHSFEGETLPDGSIELCWVGSEDAGVSGVRILRTNTSGDSDYVFDNLLPFDSEATCFTDFEVAPLEEYQYSLSLVYESGMTVNSVESIRLRAGAEASSLPASFTLYQNRPNPFNAGTQIDFEVSAASAENVTIDIFDILGRHIETVYNESSLAMGSYTCYWNGRNNFGHELASGMYFYRLTIDGDYVTRQMVLLK